MGTDLYWDVLLIPKEKRPPTYFDLLGLDLGESDPTLIEAAVLRQVKRVKANQTGPHSDQCVRLIKELAQAKATLMDPKKRDEYLAILPTRAPATPAASTSGTKLTANTTPGVAKPAGPKPVSVHAPIKKPAPKDELAGLTAGPTPTARRPKKSGAGIWVIVGGLAVLVVGVGIAIAVVLNSSKTKELPPVVVAPTAPKSAATSPVIPVPVDLKDNVAVSDPHELLPVLDEMVMEKPVEPRSFKRHTGLVQAVALAPNGRRFLSASVDSKFLDWKIDDARSFQRHSFKAGMAGVAYAPNGRQAVCCDEGSVCLFDLTKNVILSKRTYPRGNAQCLAFDPDGLHVLVGGTDGTLHWWNLADEKAEKTIEIGDNVAVNALALSIDGMHVVAGMSDGSLGIWEVGSRTKLWRGIAHAGGVAAVAFSPDGKRVASAGRDKTAAMWAIAGGPSIKRFPHENAVYGVAFLAGGSQIVTGGQDSTVRVWDVESGNPLRTLKAAAPVHCMAVQREDKFLIAGGLNGSLQLIVLKDALSDPSLRETPPVTKYPVPEAAELDSAILAIRNAYRTQLESDKPEEKEALYDRLMVRAVGKESKPARFALFREARDVAARLGKIPQTYKAIEEMDKWFAIDLFAEKSGALTLAASEGPAAAQKGVIDEATAMLAVAEKDARVDVAKQLLQAMTQAAAKSANPVLVKQVDDFQKKRSADADMRDRVATLLAKLKEMPNDPDANLAYGLILCSQEKWKDGLPMLAKGADKPLAEIAAKDIVGAKDLKGRNELADAWWGLSKTAEESKLVCLTRAKFWYDQFKNDLKGEDKLTIASRISGIEDQLGKIKKPDPGTVIVTPRPTPKRVETVERKNFNTVKTEALFKSEWKYDGEFRVESGGIRLSSGKGEITSTFQLTDNWKVAIALTPDSREIQIEVNQETFTLVAYGNASIVIVERKKDKLGYTFEYGGRQRSGNVIQLKDDRLGPSAITIRTEKGNTFTKSDGTLLLRIEVTGKVRYGAATEEKQP